MEIIEDEWMNGFGIGGHRDGDVGILWFYQDILRKALRFFISAAATGSYKIAISAFQPDKIFLFFFF